MKNKMDLWLRQSLHPQNVSLVAVAASELARLTPFEPLDTSSTELHVKRALVAATMDALPSEPRAMVLKDLQAINEQAATAAQHAMLFGTRHDTETFAKGAEESTRQARVSKINDASKNEQEKRKLSSEESFFLRRASSDARAGAHVLDTTDNRM